MFPRFIGVLEIMAVLGTFSSLAYYCLCIWGAASFLRDRKHLSEGLSQPPVSILKPLKGTDPEMYENFRRHCLQDYGEYEILFGVSDANDPAVALVEKLKQEFPQCAIQLIVCSEKLGTNIKVSNLAQMLAHARHEFLVVNDSDIRVDAGYLRSIIAPLAAGAGLVTFLYRGVAAPTLGSRLEAVGISTDFIAGVLAARQLEGINFGLGSTLAFRHQDLQAIGGFEILLDYLADDYELGHRIAASGKRVELSGTIVETFLPAYSFRGFVQHQLRWARTVRDSRKAGYLGLGLTFGLPWAFSAVVFSRGASWAWWLLALTAGMRLLVAYLVGSKVLEDRQVAHNLWLVPFRDLIALGVWLISFTGHTVEWRGDQFLLKDGKLARLSS